MTTRRTMIRKGHEARRSGWLTYASTGVESTTARSWKLGRSKAAAAGVLALGLTAAGLTAVPARAINSNPPTGPGQHRDLPDARHGRHRRATPSRPA